MRRLISSAAVAVVAASGSFRSLEAQAGPGISLGVEEQAVLVLPWDRFASFMAADTPGPWIERAWSPEVRVRGTLATMWVEYDFHFGQTPSHCGVDAVQLLKTTFGWKIVSLADTCAPTGCPTRDPPGL